METADDGRFSRLRLLYPEPAYGRIRKARVAVFGLGGVGGWCAEALARSGVGKMMLVDFDRICPSNCNRQLPATCATVGELKAETLARRFREINPELELEVRPEAYTEETARGFRLEDYDFAVDAIDSVPHKAALVRHALATPGLTLFSSMGAALKTDPFLIRATAFRKVEGDGLARALRQRFKKTGGMPEKAFTCVWSPERRENAVETGERANGSVAHVTGAFGLALASLVLSACEREGK